MTLLSRNSHMFTFNAVYKKYIRNLTICSCTRPLSILKHGLKDTRRKNVQYQCWKISRLASQTSSWIKTFSCLVACIVVSRVGGGLGAQDAGPGKTFKGKFCRSCVEHIANSLQMPDDVQLMQQISDDLKNWNETCHKKQLLMMMVYWPICCFLLSF